MEDQEVIDRAVEITERHIAALGTEITALMHEVSGKAPQEIASLDQKSDEFISVLNDLVNTHGPVAVRLRQEADALLDMAGDALLRYQAGKGEVVTGYLQNQTGDRLN